MNRKSKRIGALIAAMMLVLMLVASSVVSFAADAEEPATTAAADSSSVVVNVDGEDVEYDLADEEGASAYVDSYADNLTNDSNFETNIKTALAKVRESIKTYATFWALLPPIIAIVLALITKEVYSSLFIGILAGGLIYSNFNFEKTVVHVFKEGFIDSVADSYNIGIIIFLVLLGALVAMMNKTGGSAAFGRWAAKHIKTTLGAQLATIALGVLIFIDDYFNCLTVGSVMRPVTDAKKVSREKLSYLIDATAAPVCIIAPISSWAAAVAGFAKGAGAESGMSLFVRAIPFNFYAILTIVMMLFISITRFDYGPMKKFEAAARMGKAIEEIDARKSDELKENDKGKVIDLLIPVLFLIIACVIGMIYSGGFFTEGEEGYHNFVTAFSNSDASVGLVYGSFITIIFAVIYFLCRRVISFKDCMEAIPEGLKAMTPAILILVCAWTLKTMTDSLGAKIFISQLVDGNITIIAISACMAGAVCGDHCSPISDTTIMASAGAECNHINHVSTQLPYALTVAGVSFVSYIIAGFIQSAWIALPISIALMIGTLFVLKLILGKKESKAK